MILRAAQRVCRTHGHGHIETTHPHQAAERRRCTSASRPPHAEARVRRARRLSVSPAGRHRSAARHKLMRPNYRPIFVRRQWRRLALYLQERGGWRDSQPRCRNRRSQWGSQDHSANSPPQPPATARGWGNN